MWIVQVIERGTGKLLNEFWGRDRDLVDAKRKEFELEYPNQNVCFDYNSQNVRGLGQNKRKKGQQNAKTRI